MTKAKTNTPDTLERLEKFRDRLYSAMRSQEQDVIVNGPNHPGLLEPMAGILRALLDEFDAILPLLCGPAPVERLSLKGLGFDPLSGGFTELLIGGRRYSKQQVIAALRPKVKP